MADIYRFSSRRQRLDHAFLSDILTKHGFRCLGYRMGEETDRFLAREIADFVLE